MVSTLAFHAGVQGSIPCMNYYIFNFPFSQSHPSGITKPSPIKLETSGITSPPNAERGESISHFPPVGFSDCSASNNQDSYDCSEAIDGITNENGNGWAYSGLAPAWAIFELTEEKTMNILVIMSGQERTYHRLIIFKVTLEVNGQWINLNGLKVQEDHTAQIGEDGTVTLASGIWNLTLKFYAVSNVQSIRLDVTETDDKNNNAVVNEIIPKIEIRECPDNCTDPSQGTCTDYLNGTCTCENGFTGDNCAGKLEKI